MLLKRMMRKILLTLMIMTAGFQTTYAACTFSTTAGYIQQTVNVNVPLSGTFSVPEGAPVGTIIASGDVTDTANRFVEIKCNKTDQFYNRFNLSFVPAPSDGWSPPAGQRVYKTSVQGVGLHFYFISGQMSADTTCSNTTSCKSYPLGSWSYRLVKTGPVASGVISGSSLPQISRYRGQSDSMVNLLNISFSGSATITVPTCTTPEVTVDMGTWDINKFTGKDSVTGWRDATIKMVNCQRFYGNGYAKFNLSGQVTSDFRQNNTWTLKLTPQNGTINSSTGIMSIDTTQIKAASGLGIQLSYGTTSSAGTELVNFASTKTASIPTTGVSTITIPLAARYIQTENTVKPGKANGKATFTITYK